VAQLVLLGKIHGKWSIQNIVGASVYWEPALGGAIEVAIAIAGFSGIVAVFGRDAGDWSNADRLLLRMLLTASASSCIFSFLPFVLLEAGIDQTLCWKSASGAVIVWSFGVAIYRYTQLKKIGLSTTDVWWSRSISLFGVVTMLLQILNVAVYGEAWLYLIGVLFQLTVAFGAFVRLLLASLVLDHE
jgi:hypothetical protein